MRPKAQRRPETDTERTLRRKMITARREAKAVRAELAKLSNAVLVVVAELDLAAASSAAGAVNALELANDLARRHLGAGITGPRSPAK